MKILPLKMTTLGRPGSSAGAEVTLTKQDVQKLLLSLDVEMSSTQLGLVMRQLGAF